MLNFTKTDSEELKTTTGTTTTTEVHTTNITSKIQSNTSKITT
jgi:hypothetical protein